MRASGVVKAKQVAEEPVGLGARNSQVLEESLLSFAPEVEEEEKSGKQSEKPHLDL